MSEPDDTCRPVEIDGEIIRVRGSSDMSDEARAALAEVIRAAKRKFAAEHPARLTVDTITSDQLDALQDQVTTFAAIFEGFGRLLATSSRDWGTYRVDAWLYAVTLGWDCEQTEHDDTCTHGAMEEMAEQHGWDEATVAKARRYRTAVRAALDEPKEPTP